MKKYILLALMLFSFNVLAEGGYNQEQAPVKPEFPSYYPKTPVNKGYIQNIELKKGLIQINGVYYKIKNYPHVYFPSLKDGTLSMLHKGDSILFTVNNDIIKKIWFLPSQFSVPNN